MCVELHRIASEYLKDQINATTGCIRFLYVTKLNNYVLIKCNGAASSFSCFDMAFKELFTESRAVKETLFCTNGFEWTF